MSALRPPSISDVATALELLSARVPDRHVTPDAVMAASWHADLQRFDCSVTNRAAREWSKLTFPSVAEFVEACVETDRAIAAEERDARRSGTLVTRACPDACDGGWVLLTLGTVDVVRPCSVCAPVEFAMWEHRHWPDHDDDHCQDCLGLRRRQKVEPQWLQDARSQAARRGPSPLAMSDNAAPVATGASGPDPF